MSKETRESGAQAKVKVGIVNYLNTRPLLYGLERAPIAGEIELIGDYPSRLVERLKNGEIDLGLIPVAAIPELSNPLIIGNYCIGTEGEIASVALFSEVPMQEIKKVWLDYQSRSSVALLKWLMKEYWGIAPVLEVAEDETYLHEIRGTSAGLVIGDRALQQRRISTFIYDLGSEWRSITGLPFVFAAWVSTKPLPEKFVKMFDEANGTGLEHLDEIIAEVNPAPYDLSKYYKVHLSYHLDQPKREGMNYFLELLREK